MYKDLIPDQSGLQPLVPLHLALHLKDLMEETERLVQTIQQQMVHDQHGSPSYGPSHYHSPCYWKDNDGVDD